MAERNMIREGFVFNTLNNEGTISGSQYVDPGQLYDLVDEDYLSTSLVITGTENIVLTADLGARWKLDRIELYSDEASASNFSMEISDNGLDFRDVAMSGSAGLWVGDMDPTTISGAPRYIRYNHLPAINTNVYEWVAVNDEDLVDFGVDGSQTALTIDDSPIGGVSSQVETLTIRNNFSKSADGFIFIDRTFNAAEDELEISLSPNGPWVGRNSAGVNQPELAAWELGKFNGVRVVPSGLLTVSFSDGDAKSWTTEGATFTIVDGRIRATTTAVDPLLYVSSEFVTLAASQTVSISDTTNEDKFSLRAADADTVRVVAQITVPIPNTDLVEGPRLFWKTEQDVESTPQEFRSELSTLSTFGNAKISSVLNSYEFNVSSVPTWSGNVRGLGFRPFTTATGLGYQFDVLSVEVFDSLGERLGLEPSPVEGPPFSYYSNNIDTVDRLSGNRTVISEKHVIPTDCIITKVGFLGCESNSDTGQGACILREKAGSSFPNPGDNWDVIHAASFNGATSDTLGVSWEIKVFWAAKAGDRVGFFTNQIPGIFFTQGNLGDNYHVSPTTSGGLGTFDDLNEFTDRFNDNTFAATDRDYLIFYEAVSPGSLGYQATGTYRTPVFDAGASPTLAMLDFDSNTPSDSSIDSLGQIGFDSVEARASDTPPFTGLGLGEVGLVPNSTQTLTGMLNRDSVYQGTADGPYQINTRNGTIEFLGDNNNYLISAGLSALYNENTNELWVLNCAVSGTDPFLTTNVSLLWDVYDPATGDWLRTDHMKGDLPFGYSSPFTSGAANTDEFFSGIGFLADYTRDEIYIIQRSPHFGIGAGRYFGVVMDTAGNYKDVCFRNGTLNFDGNSDTTSFGRSRAMAYAPNLRDPRVTDENLNGIFFVVNDDDFVDNTQYTGQVIGYQITAFRNGDITNERDNQAINTTLFSAIPGLGFTISTEFGVKAIEYKESESRLYLLFDNITGLDGADNRSPYIIALDVSINTITNEVEYAASGISAPALGTAPIEFGFSQRFSNQTFTGVINPNADPTLKSGQSHDFTMDMAYCSARGTFYILRSLMGALPRAFPFEQTPASFTLYNRRALSFLYECGAGDPIFAQVPAFPSDNDALWSTVSGSLLFQDIASEGVNFPTGRYVQVEYQFNSSSDQLNTPTLLSSKIAQGLRIGSVSAGGSIDIYVRTNIPADKMIGDQQGRLKVFWESLE